MYSVGKGISSLIVVQVLTKLFTFILNQLLIKFITPEIIGISSYLEFIYNSILFFSRESVRLSVQRIKNDKRVFQKVVNFGFIPLLISIPIIGIITIQSMYSNNIQNLITLPYWKVIISTYLVSVYLELVIEPIYCLYQYQLDFAKRSKFESIATFMKCITTFASIIVFSRYALSEIRTSVFILSFGIGQLLYSITLFILYSYSFLSFKQVEYRLVKLKEEKQVYYFQGDILSIFKSFFIQMIFKQFLTEGDKLLISYLCTVKEQGIYTIISNYGSILARLLFQPLEESTRLLFTKISNHKESLSYLKLICLINGFEIDALTIVKYVIPSVLVSLIYWIVQYALIGVKTNSLNEFVWSFCICVLLLGQLMYLERKTILQYIKR
ncbi:unnamed protein product [Candida verbasci]|uniref:Man(5)GlcNAc(2)-PP-dolichol translocation protein RFT1 n=1 Tax=Candida verbasci TaxID=1227364 RepID=A0A9W4TUF4_9ASCO|nr:unnamed protein product [Candida verbasci]